MLSIVDVMRILITHLRWCKGQVNKCQVCEKCVNINPILVPHIYIYIYALL